jgi:hypothetical protein
MKTQAGLSSFARGKSKARARCLSRYVQTEVVRAFIQEKSLIVADGLCEMVQGKHYIVDDNFMSS